MEEYGQAILLLFRKKGGTKATNQMPGKGAVMVKGVARHAVIVKSPDLKDFEQAIFIVSGNPSEPRVQSPADMLRLACDLASRYNVSSVPQKRRSGAFGYVMCFLSGSMLTAALWWLASTLVY